MIDVRQDMAGHLPPDLSMGPRVDESVGVISASAGRGGELTSFMRIVTVRLGGSPIFPPWGSHLTDGLMGWWEGTSSCNEGERLKRVAGSNRPSVLGPCATVREIQSRDLAGERRRVPRPRQA